MARTITLTSGSSSATLDAALSSALFDDDGNVLTVDGLTLYDDDESTLLTDDEGRAGLTADEGTGDTLTITYPAIHATTVEVS